eukprot:CAMPEP_0175987852 /NCGR_PEP_ID=MMETSP0108-20121206/50931_1 /TAXON_ID=195067 ORGANISM="Goniomonas pacifica, Strain CCMP1869" /NCGR_SAMPLE_ID=MMETSP0108 /ASSEMBLY_ACC=CAM_ASM_000204 /LENGTH=199 /DNA_ID=CAMNT_0017319159 /DNA_START=1 /DNA_END=600 /DNA_ORIENTATION=-
MDDSGNAGWRGMHGVSVETDTTDWAVFELEEELAAISDDFADGKMQAFGHNHDTVLQQVSHIRQGQTDLFMKHFQEESALPNINVGFAESEKLEEKEFTKVSKWFQEKKGNIDKLTTQLQDLTRRRAGVACSAGPGLSGSRVTRGVRLAFGLYFETSLNLLLEFANEDGKENRHRTLRLEIDLRPLIRRTEHLLRGSSE